MKGAKKELYNCAQKEEYLSGESNSFTKESTLKYFYRLSPYEKMYDKDIANMDAEEIKCSFAALNIRTETNRGQMLSLMKRYVSWVQLKEKATENSPIFNMTPDNFTSTDAIKMQMLKNPQQLEDVMDKTYDPTTHRFRYIRDKLIFRLLYAGVSVRDLPHLKKSDFNSEKNIVTDPKGKTYVLNDHIFVTGEEVSLWKECADATQIERPSKALKTKECVIFELVNNDYILRPTVRRDNDENSMYKLSTLINMVWSAFIKYSSIKDMPKLIVSCDRINDSGHFYRMYQREINGERITLDVVADVFNLDSADDNKIRVKTKIIYTNYLDWKIAFGYN